MLIAADIKSRGFFYCFYFLFCEWANGQRLTLHMSKSIINKSRHFFLARLQRFFTLLNQKLWFGKLFVSNPLVCPSVQFVPKLIVSIKHLVCVFCIKTVRDFTKLFRLREQLKFLLSVGFASFLVENIINFGF